MKKILIAIGVLLAFVACGDDETSQCQSICEQQISQCEIDYEVELCVQGCETAKADAAEAGCSSQFNALESCVGIEGVSCEGGVVEACEPQQAALIACTGEGLGE